MSYEIEPAAADNMLDVEHLMLRHDARVQAALDYARERGLEPSPSMLARVDALRERLLAVLAKSKHRGAESRDASAHVGSDVVSVQSRSAYAYDDLCALASDGVLPQDESASQQSGYYQSDHSIIDELLGLAPQKPQHGPDAADVDTDADATTEQAASLVGLDVDVSDSALTAVLLDELFSNARPGARDGNDHEPG